MTYTPTLAAQISDEHAAKVVRYAQEEFVAIARELQKQEFVSLKVWSVVPTKPRQGQIYYADGTNWNPGFGEGAYAYNGSVWVPLGGLTAALDLYVRPDGNDSNSGYADTTNGAFLTIQHAVQKAADFGRGAHGITIHLADGTYDLVDDVIYISGFPVDTVSGYGLKLVGNNDNPENVVIKTQSWATIYVENTALYLNGVELQNTQDNGIFLYVGHTGLCYTDNIRLGGVAGAGAIHLYATCGGQVAVQGHTVVSGADYHMYADIQGIISMGGTITMVGNPTFLYTVFCSINSTMYTFATFVGTAIGQRYLVEDNSMVKVFGGGPNVFPGTIAGATATGGQYV